MSSTRADRGYLDTWHRIDIWPDSVQVLGFTHPRANFDTKYALARHEFGIE